MPMPDTRSAASPLQVGYARLNDKLDAVGRQIILIKLGTAIVLLIALSSPL